MSSDIMNSCADMVLADAIEDYALKKNISCGEARNIILNSNAYKALYDLDTGLWHEGSDYFLWYSLL